MSILAFDANSAASLKYTFFNGSQAPTVPYKLNEKSDLRDKQYGKPADKAQANAPLNIRH